MRLRGAPPGRPPRSYLSPDHLRWSPASSGGPAAVAVAAPGEQFAAEEAAVEVAAEVLQAAAAVVVAAPADVQPARLLLLAAAGRRCELGTRLRGAAPDGTLGAPVNGENNSK